MSTDPDQHAASIAPGRVLRSPVLFLAFGFGSGLAPRAPGTFGTLAAVPLYLALSQFAPVVYLALVIAVCVAGIWICQRAADQLGVHDHPGIVWDEFAGLLVTMIPAPLWWPWTLAGFVLFRLFDIWKPWPISWADRHCEGGLGIMLDDVLAGGLAALVLYFLVRVAA
jgi:phosphatidylglycerophosphatase A